MEGYDGMPGKVTMTRDLGDEHRGATISGYLSIGARKSQSVML